MNLVTSNKWTQAEAIELCVKVEAIAPNSGFHVALTGGLLYREGLRKDCDLLFYSIRGKAACRPSLTAALHDVGITLESEHGWMSKATHNGKRVDLFFPETPLGEGSGQYGEP